MSDETFDAMAAAIEAHLVDVNEDLIALSDWIVTVGGRGLGNTAGYVWFSRSPGYCLLGLVEQADMDVRECIKEQHDDD